MKAYLRPLVLYRLYTAIIRPKKKDFGASQTIYIYIEECYLGSKLLFKRGFNKTCLNIYIYIYIYMCVCVCVCVCK